MKRERNTAMKHIAPLTADLKAFPTSVNDQITDSVTAILQNGGRCLGKEKN